jgi:L-asparaginase/Glu-tRNA(Gln) amidotransferase subunit D
MSKPRVAVFAGPYATIANSPPLVTSNKGRGPDDKKLSGRFDHLVPQRLYEPVTVRISRFSAHPMEGEAAGVHHDDGLPYHEVELVPEDGLYLLPYVARREDGSPLGRPFETEDLDDPAQHYGGRQFFFPDASRMFEEIDRSISGRDVSGWGNALDQRADFDFFRPLPSAGFPSQGEQWGIDFFPYQPFALSRGRPRREDLVRVSGAVDRALATGDYAGALWLECSSTIEETLYWLSLTVNNDLPIAGCAAQRPHGQVSNDGDRNIIDAVDYLVSGAGQGLGAVGIQDERIFAARDFKKGDDRPGGYKATGGHGGVLGTVGPPVTLWYRPVYRHTTESAVVLEQLAQTVAFQEYANAPGEARIRIKDESGALLPQAVPRVTMLKYGAFMDESEVLDPDLEVGIMARVTRSVEEQANWVGSHFQGFILEGDSPYAMGSGEQTAAIEVAAFSGMPVVRVARADPGGLVPRMWSDHTILGSNLDANKARILLMAAMLKLGRLPKARDARHPTVAEREAVARKVSDFQTIFDTH